LSRVSVFRLPVGRRIEPGTLRGYYIDLSSKAADAAWPPTWFPFPGFHRFIAIGQWGLGAYERYLDGQGDDWLEAAEAACAYLTETQERAGNRTGAWVEPNDYPHTFNMRGPWISAMAQGHCASLLARLAAETGSERFANAAREALRPMRVPTENGGALALLDGRPFPEEYPTAPSSFVLNGAIYAMWGLYDVWVGLHDEQAGQEFRNAIETLSTNLHRWDTGYWSRYDLYPHPVHAVNVASGSYHFLHVNQLLALDRVAPGNGFAETAQDFERYATRPSNRARAWTTKVLFRLVVPRNHFLAAHVPWRHEPHAWPESAT
jgi:hypothetical protein